MNAKALPNQPPWSASPLTRLHTHSRLSPCCEISGQNHHISRWNGLFAGCTLVPWFSRISISFREKPPLTCVSLLVNTSGFTEHLLEPPKHPVVPSQVIFLVGVPHLCAVFCTTSWLGLEVHLPPLWSRAEMYPSCPPSSPLLEPPLWPSAYFAQASFLARQDPKKSSLTRL